MDVHCYLPLLTADHRTALSQQLQQRAQQAAAELQELQQQQQQPLGTAGQKQQLHLLRRQMAAMQVRALPLWGGLWGKQKGQEGIAGQDKVGQVK